MSLVHLLSRLPAEANRRPTEDEEQDHDETFLPSCCDEQGPSLCRRVPPLPVRIWVTVGMNQRWHGQAPGDGESERDGGFEAGQAARLYPVRQLCGGADSSTLANAVREAFWSLLCFSSMRGARLKMDQDIGLRLERVYVRYNVNFKSILRYRSPVGDSLTRNQPLPFWCCFSFFAIF
jgi:hypothetical protein